ncbi:hypothetical protein G7Y89_g5038 [Cudoniella acicularis]|uniref:CCD97-like C-terminal domain-containing protein n=1 Tax=Cudoniella acicularis TaxID=354080 RepID=A0A8H4RN81_9HELO|nr:hypothetical protein G7Y89_g5038 [Cudoniella acicularis]
MPHMQSPPPQTQEQSSPSHPHQISPQIRIKNRRKLYLDRHPSYFTSPDLELLDPLLYDRCVRRFQTPAEREADGRSKGYSGVLEADLYRSEAKIAALQKGTMLPPASGEPIQLSPSSSAPYLPFVSYARGKDGEVLLEEEDEIPSNREDGFERWKFAMTIRFLKGEDPDFDYRAVDESEEWDVIERVEEEERWFEDEEPSWVGEDRKEGTEPDGQLRRVVEAEAEKAKHRRNGEEETFKVAGANKDDEIPKETVRDLAPFPLNRSFISQAVLSEELREEIWRRIMIEGKSVREVSAELSVEMSRVGAVVRLMEVEKEWKRIGKPLARPYAKAVMSMLPSTPYDAERGIPYDPVRERKIIHESINDLPVHASTGQQIFHPTSESRQFTRADAAKVFNEKLLPADERIPHPELVLQHREVLAGLSRQEREERARAREEEAEAKQLKAAMVKAKKDAKTKKFETPRWEFRFTEANVDATGKDGRGYKGVGWRYGVPLYDRSRGQIKIPKAVE